MENGLNLQIYSSKKRTFTTHIDETNEALGMQQHVTYLAHVCSTFLAQFATSLFWSRFA